MSDVTRGTFPKLDWTSENALTSAENLYSYVIDELQILL